MEAEMDHTLLTAVHPRTIAPVKMDARREQEYYDRAAASQALPEKVFAIWNRTQQVARLFMTLTRSRYRIFGDELTEPRTSF
jgi:hypothetical protein